MKDEGIIIERWPGKLRFLADKGVPLELVEDLRSYSRFRVETVQDVGLTGNDDSELWQYCRKNKLWLLTTDEGFLDNRLFPLAQCPTVMIVPTSYDKAVKSLAGFLEMTWDELISLFQGRKITAHPEAFKAVGLDHTGKRRVFEVLKSGYVKVDGVLEEL